jgi:hypothetical protein
MEWRRKWAANWDRMRFCSDRCRRNRPGKREFALEGAIRDRAARAAAGATFCPSEVARAFGGDDWRTWMEPTRQAARRLIDAGELEMLQRGRSVDPSTAKGPIRLRRIAGLRAH